MGQADQSRLNELAWLAFVAQERGWDSLAERIAADVASISSHQAAHPSNSDCGTEDDDREEEAA